MNFEEPALIRCRIALLHGSHGVDSPLVTGRHATIFADSGMLVPSSD